MCACAAYAQKQKRKMVRYEYWHHASSSSTIVQKLSFFLIFYKCELLTSTLKAKQIKVSSIKIFWYWLFLKISIIK